MVTLGGLCESLVGTVLGKVLDYPVVVALGRGRKEGKAVLGWGSLPAPEQQTPVFEFQLSPGNVPAVSMDTGRKSWKSRCLG